MIIEGEKDNLVRPRFGNCKIDVRNREPAACRHNSILVDEHSVECATCKEKLNAIAVLLDFARRERNLRGWESERNRVAKEIEQLKAQRARLRAAIRRDTARGGGE